MNTALLFEFSVNKENRTIHVKREFNAGPDLVWQAWTTAALLDQWWAPQPYRTETKAMDFRPGGQWLYAMIGPENKPHWSLMEYKEIMPRQSFSGLDAFCDEEGNINMNLPRSFWHNVFTAGQHTTIVTISITYDNQEDLERIIQMGFKEGFTMGLQNLDTLLSSLQK